MCVYIIMYWLHFKLFLFISPLCLFSPAAQRLVLETCVFLSRTVDILLAPPVLNSQVRTLRPPRVLLRVITVESAPHKFDIEPIREQVISEIYVFGNGICE